MLLVPWKITIVSSEEKWKGNKKPGGKGKTCDVNKGMLCDETRRCSQPGAHCLGTHSCLPAKVHGVKTQL